jgi:hypothetical protein
MKKSEYDRGWNAAIRFAAGMARAHRNDFARVSGGVVREPVSAWTSKEAKMEFLKEMAGIILECDCIARAIQGLRK